MKRIIRIASAFMLAITLFTTTSCYEDNEETIIPFEQQLLTAKHCT